MNTFGIGFADNALEQSELSNKMMQLRVAYAFRSKRSALVVANTVPVVA